MEPVPDDRHFVGVFNLRAAFLAVERRLILLADALIFLTAESARGKVARRPAAGVEILMPQRGKFLS